jgi:hypothetical protein
LSPIHTKRVGVRNPYVLGFVGKHGSSVRRGPDLAGSIPGFFEHHPPRLGRGEFLHLLPNRIAVKRATSLLVNLAVFTVAVLVALFLGEGVVRLVEPQQLIKPNQDVWRPDSLLGWWHQEDADLIINTGDRPARFVTDHRGYRINAPGEFPTPVRPDYRVLAIGDSFVEALMVNGEETFTKLLERKLVDNGVAAEVVNSGVGGWSPRQYLLKSEQALQGEHFDLGILFFYVGNDLIGRDEGRVTWATHGRRFPLRWPRSLRYGEIVDAVLYPINNFFEMHSHLYVFLKQRGEVVLSRVGLTAYYFPEVFNLTDANEERWVHTVEICQQIESVFREHDVPVIFVMIPAPYQVHEEVFYKYLEGFSIPKESVDLEQPNREFGGRMKAEVESPFIDLLEPLRERARSGKRLYGVVDRHLNEAGHRAVAEILLPVVYKTLTGSNMQKEGSK